MPVKVECPVCFFEFEVASPRPKDLVVCPDCARDLEVVEVGVEPSCSEVVLRKVPVDEDWGE
ncbi:MAG: lysine biosynthesis protein LysW [Promethearchaeota archaeon]